MTIELVYERIFERAYDTKIVRDDAGNVTVERTVRDADLDVLYQTLRRMATAGQIAEEAFVSYARHHRAKLEGRLTLVEVQQTIEKAERNEALAHMMRSVLLGRHQGFHESAPTWFPIASTPTGGKPVRILGTRHDDGKIYIETAEWDGSSWHIEGGPLTLVSNLKPPTHWSPLEKLPPEYEHRKEKVDG